jgi:hypothetical protein
VFTFGSGQQLGSSAAGPSVNEALVSFNAAEGSGLASPRATCDGRIAWYPAGVISGKLALAVGSVTLLCAATTQAEESRSRVKSRDVISADETTGAPPGFHAEKRPRYGVIISGAVATSVGAAMVLTGLEQRAEMKTRQDSAADPGSGGEFFMIYGGLSMAVGVPLLAYGLLSPREVYVRDSSATVALGLSVDHRHLRGGLTLAF